MNRQTLHLGVTGGLLMALALLPLWAASAGDVGPWGAGAAGVLALVVLVGIGRRHRCGPWHAAQAGLLVAVLSYAVLKTVVVWGGLLAHGMTLPAAGVAQGVTPNGYFSRALPSALGWPEAGGVVWAVCCAAVSGVARALRWRPAVAAVRAPKVSVEAYALAVPWLGAFLGMSAQHLLLAHRELERRGITSWSELPDPPLAMVILGCTLLACWFAGTLWWVSGWMGRLVGSYASGGPARGMAWWPIGATALAGIGLGLWVFVDAIRRISSLLRPDHAVFLDVALAAVWGVALWRARTGWRGPSVAWGGRQARHAPLDALCLMAVGWVWIAQWVFGTLVVLKQGALVVLSWAAEGSWPAAYVTGLQEVVHARVLPGLAQSGQGVAALVFLPLMAWTLSALWQAWRHPLPAPEEASWAVPVEEM